MKELITSLLNYSRVENVEAMECEPVNLEEAVAGALDNLRTSIEEAHAEVSWEKLPNVLGDRGQLVQLMQNLIGNSVRYRSEAPPRIRITSVRRENQWEISVKDNGIGIAPQHCEQVFEIFKRLHTRDEYPGTGIGLAVCRKIVQRHGGQIAVDSQLGGGSVFRFTLPAATSEEAQDETRHLACAI
jgi:light-regulated signal transduction histidine kinase (bacteriophytochrome)